MSPPMWFGFLYPPLKNSPAWFFQVLVLHWYTVVVLVCTINKECFKLMDMKRVRAPKGYNLRIDLS